MKILKSRQAPKHRRLEQAPLPSEIRRRLAPRYRRTHPLVELWHRPGRKRFLDTHPRNLPRRYAALRRRRAKNAVAKQSRKANR